MSKTSENSFASRLASITGANISKVAGFGDSHAVTDEQVMAKLASLSVGDMIENDHFVRGFENRLAERIGELDEAMFKLMS